MSAELYEFTAGDIAYRPKEMDRSNAYTIYTNLFPERIYYYRRKSGTGLFTPVRRSQCNTIAVSVDEKLKLKD